MYRNFITLLVSIKYPYKQTLYVGYSNELQQILRKLHWTNDRQKWFTGIQHQSEKKPLQLTKQGHYEGHSKSRALLI